MRGLTRASPPKAAPRQAASDHSGPDRAASDQAASDHSGPDQASPDRAASDQASPHQAVPGKPASGRPALRSSARRIAPRRAALLTGGAFVGFAAVGGLMLAGCGAGSQGLRKEGPASTTWPSEQADSSGSSAYESSPASTSRKQKVDAVALVKKDPKVSERLKANLKPCGKSTATAATGAKNPSKSKGYPVDVAYGRLTGATASDLVINITTCTEGFGIGSYVYRKVGGAYENVFMDERPPVYADIAKGHLRVTKLIYTANDSVCCPSGEDVTTYRWAETRRQFLVSDRKVTNANEDETPAPDDGTEG
ncbi:hypothetical protein [Streptomyces sparsogenes]|uniref:Lipoprotein CseA n=1 Tax=Streptomyces sparsogenes DSM 40356 TaxID=1331668 RepID=A0A1R1SJN2_9ACTN|nr:hypothetical protein [Streptomyces sparsogenes]OMI38447.1 hypothetical protein SPAR_16087 [Streptomyces sparsogenes DSM 40356]